LRKKIKKKKRIKRNKEKRRRRNPEALLKQSIGFYTKQRKLKIMNSTNFLKESARYIHSRSSFFMAL
jgi:hypothetical protein